MHTSDGSSVDNANLEDQERDEGIKLRRVIGRLVVRNGGGWCPIVRSVFSGRTRH
jgi:hypothetical protein